VFLLGPEKVTHFEDETGTTELDCMAQDELESKWKKVFASCGTVWTLVSTVWRKPQTNVVKIASVSSELRTDNLPNELRLLPLR
jgi:hypothetical protein